MPYAVYVTSVETLHHVLNNCGEMLERYGWRHDSILSFIYSQFKSDPNVEILVDLPTKLKGISTLPTDIIQTTLRPDLVLVN